jgi:hypothetical protein
MTTKFDPKRMLQDMLKNAAKRLKTAEPVEKKYGRNVVNVMPMEIDILKDEFVHAYYSKMIAGIEAYQQAEQECDKLLDDFLEHIGLTRADGWSFVSLQNDIALKNTKNSTAIITPQLVQARKLLGEFLEKDKSYKTAKFKPFLKMTNIVFKCIDRGLKPEPEIIRELATAMDSFDSKKMPEAKQIKDLLLQGWTNQEGKREVRLTHRPKPTDNERVVSIRNYIPQPTEE